jgi:hypothetical protein
VNVTDIKGLVTFNIAVFQVVSDHFYFLTGRYWGGTELMYYL